MWRGSWSFFSFLDSISASDSCMRTFPFEVIAPDASDLTGGLATRKSQHQGRNRAWPSSHPLPPRWLKLAIRLGGAPRELYLQEAIHAE